MIKAQFRIGPEDVEAMRSHLNGIEEGFYTADDFPRAQLFLDIHGVDVGAFAGVDKKGIRHKLPIVDFVATVLDTLESISIGCRETYLVPDFTKGFWFSRETDALISIGHFRTGIDPSGKVAKEFGSLSVRCDINEFRHAFEVLARELYKYLESHCPELLIKEADNKRIESMLVREMRGGQN